MLAYAIALTFVLGVIVGVAGTVGFAEWLDSREWSRYQARKAQQKSDSSQMDDAVALVSDKLGATVISQD